VLFSSTALFERRSFRALHFFKRCTFRAVLFSSAALFERCTQNNFNGARLPSSMWRDQGRTPKKLFHVWSALIGMDGIARQTLFLHF